MINLPFLPPNLFLHHVSDGGSAVGSTSNIVLVLKAMNDIFFFDFFSLTDVPMLPPKTHLYFLR